MPLAVQDKIQVSYRGTWQDQRIILTQNYYVVNTVSTNTVASDLNTISGYFSLAGIGSFRNNYLACLPTDYMLDFVRAQRVAPDRSLYVDTVVGAAGAGPSIASTGNLQFPITLHTDIGARNQIAVKKVGPAPNGTYADGKPDPTFLAGALFTFANELLQHQITLAPAIELAPIVLHGDGSGDPVMGFRLPDHVGTMRRRTFRVGE